MGVDINHIHPDVGIIARVLTHWDVCGFVPRRVDVVFIPPGWTGTRVI